MERSPREVSGNLAEVPGRGQPIGRHNDSVSHDVLPSIAPLHCDLAPSILLRFAHACPLCLRQCPPTLLLGISSCIYQMVAACSAPNDTKLRHFGTGIIRHFPWPLFLYGSLLLRLTLLWFTAPPKRRWCTGSEWCCDSCDSWPSYRHERAR